MRRISLLILLFISCWAQAQKQDYFNLFTDRDLYVSGETILFKLFAPGGEESGIARIDLVTTGGEIVSEVNKKLTNHQADGFLYIPDSLKTGTYLLCVSSKFNSIRTVKELLIGNRFTGMTETNSILRFKAPESVVVNKTGIQLDGIAKDYKSRDKVHLIIRLSPELRSQLQDDLLVAAVGHTPGYNSGTFIQPSSSKVHHAWKSPMAIDGMAIDPVTGQPFKNGCICLSIPDSIPMLQYYMTGEDGHFQFQLDNCYGKVPVFVQGFDLERKRLLKIKINFREKFPGDSVPAEIEPVSTELQKSVARNIETASINKIFNYHEINISDPPLKDTNDYPFYGVPTEVVYPALYIDLPDFTEISRELLPGVKFRAYNRIPTMQILNPATLNYYEEQPLVLLDGIPVQDLNVIKNMGTKEISRIEICRTERFYGDLKFSGVVAIYTTIRDFRQLAESNDLIKLSINALQPDGSLVEPVNRPVNEPDLRKTLLWKPATKPGDTISLEFGTADLPGVYRVIVRGKTNDGKMVGCEHIFEVK